MKKRLNKKLILKLFLLFNIIIVAIVLILYFVFNINLFGIIYKNTINGTDIILELQTDNNQNSKFFTVNVFIKADQSVNLARADIMFDASFCKVNSIDMDKSFANIIFRESFSNTSGIVSIVGGLSYPGFQGKGLLAKINFEKKSLITDGYIGLLSSSGIYANDGFGTNLFLFTENNLINVR